MDALVKPIPAGARPPRQAATAYQPEVDGLRAIAVVAVILTHLGVPGFTGGFLGVDIFFVISGYLIYGDLLARSRQGAVSVRGFYARRLRRTLPALYVMVGICLVAGWLLLMPGDFVRLARGAVATLLLIPNVLFLTQSGYFEPSAAANPLLHTWSLGVEAQFYVLCPLLPPLLLRRSIRVRVLALVILSALSLAAGMLMLQANPGAAFYLMPARLWEFLIGGLLAERVLPAIGTRWLRELLAGGGLLVLLACIALFSSATPHPSPLTLVPCLATAALIHAAGGTVTGRMLRSRIPVFIGLISYSLYLWHWPLMVFAHDADVPSTLTTGAIGAVGLAGLSTLSWIAIETPFRAPRSFCRRSAFPILSAGAVALSVCGLGILGGRGLPGRLPGPVAAVAGFYDYAEGAPFREGTCFITSKDRLSAFKSDPCLRLDPATKNVLLIGDSHAAHLWTGLRDTWPGINVLQATASGCKPVLHPAGAARCTGLMNDMLTRFLPAHHVDAIVIAALWDDADIPALLETIRYLKPLAGRIDVIGPMPRYDEPVSNLLAESLLRHDPGLMDRHRLASVPALDARMAADMEPLAHYVSVYRALCPDGHCLLFAEPGVPMQFDYHHLTAQGAARLMAILRSENVVGF